MSCIITIKNYTISIDRTEIGKIRRTRISRTERRKRRKRRKRRSRKTAAWQETKGLCRSGISRYESGFRVLSVRSVQSVRSVSRGKPLPGLFLNAVKPDDAVFSGEDPVEIISRGMDFDGFPIECYRGRFAAADLEEGMIPGQRDFQLGIERFPDLYIFPESQFSYDG